MRPIFASILHELSANAASTIWVLQTPQTGTIMDLNVRCLNTPESRHSIEAWAEWADCCRSAGTSQSGTSSTVTNAYVCWWRGCDRCGNTWGNANVVSSDSAPGEELTMIYAPQPGPLKILLKVGRIIFRKKCYHNYFFIWQVTNESE